ncbi:MAG: RnfABCDGE type electron transport complex subunit B [Nitrosomonas sp.]|nr:RnfABCDGE type electron transport complex subunit B [Nitrosomonas sp.]
MQCGQCGYSGCEPYAAAIVEGRADINQCPPGDDDGIRNIATLLGIEPKPLNTRHGLPKPRVVAVIDENLCIGCTFCIRACPVDAIVGAAKQMHTVLTDECTGCELCMAPCPMDCIAMVPVVELQGTAGNSADALKRKADHARSRYQFRQQRLSLDKTKNKETTVPPLTDEIYPQAHFAGRNCADSRKHDIVQSALRRAAAMRAQINK